MERARSPPRNVFGCESCLRIEDAREHEFGVSRGWIRPVWTPPEFRICARRLDSFRGIRATIVSV